MAESNDILKSTAVTLHQLTADEEMRLRCEARERYYADEQCNRLAGIQEGMQKGIQKGYKDINQLNTRLMNDNRLEDLKRSMGDSEYQIQLLKEYGII